MWVVYPPGFDATKKYPVMMLLHGGPHVGMTDALQWRWNAEVFAGWGYVVTWHNFHGSSGFGNDFADSINPDWITLPYEDTLKAAEWLKSRSRTSTPNAWSPRAAATADSSPPRCQAGRIRSRRWSRTPPCTTCTRSRGRTTAAARNDSSISGSKPEEFEKYSPHVSAGNFNTPMLVIHGQLDLRVPVNHSLELFNTLQKRGVPSKLVYFPDENHWVLKPQNSLFWYQTVRDWVATYAAPGPL